jgi:hypothetical protein
LTSWESLEPERPSTDRPSLWETVRTFGEIRALYRAAVRESLAFYLESEGEAELVLRRTFEQAERVWDALDNEIGILELLARTAAFQCGLLMPRRDNLPKRRVPTDAQLYRYLERYRLERRIAELEARMEAVQASAREAGVDVEQRLETIRAGHDAMIQQFYRRWYDFGDEDQANGAVGCLLPVTPPRRGPEGGRTFDEALAPPRDP